jgi:hypothetical protein
MVCPEKARKGSKIPKEINKRMLHQSDAAFFFI